MWGSKEQVDSYTAEISLPTVQFRVNSFANKNAAVISDGRGTLLQIVTQSAWQEILQGMNAAPVPQVLILTIQALIHVLAISTPCKY